LGKILSVDGQYDIDRAEKFIKQIQSIHQVVQEQLEKSQAKYKVRHDKHRVDHSFEVVIRGSNFAQFSKCSECDENSAIASVSSS
jgi:glutamate-1-semialdehyde aminotransferase